MKPTRAKSTVQTPTGHFLSRLLDEARDGDFLDLLMERPLVVGVSGGADSVALLHALAALRGQKARTTLQVAHFNHGLRSDEALADARFVEDLARKLGVPFVSGSADVASLARAGKLSIEDAARQARYAFFRSVVAGEEERWAVAVAHTADDQAETVLMSILRGTGIAGLAGMQAVSQVPLELSGHAPAILFRPLLGIWREEVLTYLAERGLPFHEDSSNSDPSFTRNRVRHELLPLLARNYNSGIKSHLATLARIAHADDTFLERAVDQAWRDVVSVDPDGSAISVDPVRFSELHQAIQLRLVRRAVAHLSGSTRDRDFDSTRQAAILLASPGEGEMHLRGEVVVEKRDYWAGVRKPGSSVPLRAAISAYGNGWPLLGTGDHVEVTPASPQGLLCGWVCVLDIVGEASVEYGDYTAAFSLGALGEARLLLRPRLPGDRMTPLGMDGSKSLKVLYIDAKIPDVVRSRVAIFAHPATNEVLWVPGPGGRRSSLAAVTKGAKQVLRVRFVRTLEESGTGV